MQAQRRAFDSRKSILPALNPYLHSDSLALILEKESNTLEAKLPTEIAPYLKHTRAFGWDKTKNGNNGP